MNSNLFGSKWEPRAAATSVPGPLLPRPTLDLAEPMFTPADRRSYGGAAPSVPPQGGYMSQIHAFNAQLRSKQSERAAIMSSSSSAPPPSRVENFTSQANNAPTFAQSLLRSAPADAYQGTPYSTAYRTEPKQWAAELLDPSGAGASFDQFKLFEQLGHIRYMLEKQHEEEVGHVGEEFAMFMFVAVFTIFMIDSFRK